MFTTVQSFTIAGAKFVQENILNYSESLSSKTNKSDEKRQDDIFSNDLSDGVLANFEGLLIKRNCLVKILEKIRTDLPTKMEKSFNEISSKTRFFTFIFGVYSAIMIFYVGILENKILTDIHLIVFTCISSIYFLCLSFFYKLFPSNTIKKYVLATMIMFLIFISSSISEENFVISFVICFLFSYFIAKKEEKKKKTKLTELLLIIFAYSIILHIFISDFFSLRDIFLWIYSILVEPKYYNLLSLFIFTFVYFMVTLIIPVTCFYTKGKILIKSHNKHRNNVWERYDELKEIKQMISKMEKDRAKLGIEIAKIMKNVRTNKDLSELQKTELLSHLNIGSSLFSFNKK